MIRGWRQSGLIVCAVVLIASVTSHFAADWLRIKETYNVYHYYGPRDQKPQTILYGSSPAYDGIDWDAVEKILGAPIVSWAVPGSSPAEWEEQHKRSLHIKRAIIVVSPFDMDEYFICDFRANIVPLSHTINDLLQSRADWKYSENLLGKYPLMLTRILFPTVGRSDGVMVGMRLRFLALAHASTRHEKAFAPTINSCGPSTRGGRISDWSDAHIERRMVLMKESCQGKHSFNGPKQLALNRLLRNEMRKGKVILVIMPQSPVYRRAFLSEKIVSEFEASIGAIAKHFPQLRIIRVDKLSALNSNELYWDPVHLNKYGQTIATRYLLSQLEMVGGSR